MPGIRPIHWKTFDKFLEFVGCQLKRKKGDHRIYWRQDLKRPIVIPAEKELPIFIIRNNLRVLNISVEEYLEILKQM